MDLTTLITRHRDELSPAERRVADVVLRDPSEVAFGTVASLARTAGTSGASVVRLSARIGLGGFSELQELARTTMRSDAHRATKRLSGGPHLDPLDAAAEVSATTVADALRAVPSARFEDAVTALSRTDRSVVVMVAEASTGIGRQFCEDLSLLRDGVEQVHGSEVAVARRLAALERDDVVVAVDFARYDRWLLAAVGRTRETGAQVVAITDSELSPLASGASTTLVVPVGGVGPLDSHLAPLALLEALTAGVALRLSVPAATRLRRIEAGWDAAGVLEDG